jgi:hypothetical protein
MPQWLANQFRKAYLRKDRRQIRWLGEAWFLYYNLMPKKAGAASKSTPRQP